MSRIEDDFWKQKVREAQHTQLDAVRKSAAGWTALFTAVLGVFGAVTFTGGLTGVSDMSVGWKLVVRLLITAAALLALIATVLTGLAANTFPRAESDTSFQAFRDQTKRDAEKARSLLMAGMGFAAGAAVVVVGGSAASLWADKENTPKKPPTVVTIIDGEARCGALNLNGDELRVGSARLENVTSVVVVDACPT